MKLMMMQIMLLMMRRFELEYYLGELKKERLEEPALFPSYS
jgi:hypothetical protein